MFFLSVASRDIFALFFAFLELFLLFTGVPAFSLLLRDQACSHLRPFPPMLSLLETVFLQGSLSHILHTAMRKESPQIAVCDGVTKVAPAYPHKLSRHTTQNSFGKMETRTSEMALEVRVLAAKSSSQDL